MQTSCMLFTLCKLKPILLALNILVILGHLSKSLVESARILFANQVNTCH